MKQKELKWLEEALKSFKEKTTIGQLTVRNSKQADLLNTIYKSIQYVGTKIYGKSKI